MAAPAPKLKPWHKALLFLAAACAVAAFYGLERAQNVEFVCTNGDYQNYNVLRRVLAGQIPYRDFANYLGVGPLLLCAPLLALHNTFAGSLFVTNFVSAMTFILLVSLVFYLVTGNKTVSALAGLVFPKLVSSALLSLLPGYGYYTNHYLSLLLYPNNSFRSARMFLPVLLCWCMLLWLCRSGNALRPLLAAPRGAALTGFAIGLGLTWSNDFGFACLGSAGAVMVILCIADAAQKPAWARRPVWHRLLWYAAGMGAGMAGSVLLASGGHPGSWLAFTQGVSSWQPWYFGYAPDKIYSLPQLFDWGAHHRTLLHWALYAAAMGFCLYRLCRKKEDDRLILFVFLASSIVAGELVYIVGSGGDYFEEGVCALTILVFWAFVARAGLWLCVKLRALPWVRRGAWGLAALYTLFCLALDMREGHRLWQLNQTTGADYIAALEGHTRDAAPLKAMAETVGQEPLFSTFASALDDMRGTFQPTGSDYIIHALGEDRFAAYVQDFAQGRYPWVQTSSMVNWVYEQNAANSNWDFYRQLFANYTLYGEYGRWTLWSYAGEGANVVDVPVELAIDRLDAHETVLQVRSGEQRPCFVDVTVTWHNGYVLNPARLLTWRNNVFVYEPSLARRHSHGEGYHCPSTGQERHFLIFMENGSGSIRLAGMPAACTELTVSAAQVQSVILYQE